MPLRLIESFTDHIARSERRQPAPWKKLDRFDATRKLHGHAFQVVASIKHSPRMRGRTDIKIPTAGLGSRFRAYSQSTAFGGSRHSPRSSKMVNAESRTSAFAISIAASSNVSERAAFRCDSGERRCWAFGFLLAVHILSQVKAIERLTREVEALRADNAKLRAKLNLPSKTPENSSTPPSQGHKVSGEERKTPEGKRRNSHAGGTSDKA
jgi:hypothetical protein